MNTPDICEAKHKNNPESIAANKIAGETKHTLRTAVHLFLRLERPKGATPAEIAKHFNKPLHAISGRISELKSLGCVAPTDVIRNRGRVVVATRHVGQRDLF